MRALELRPSRPMPWWMSRPAVAAPPPPDLLAAERGLRPAFQPIVALSTGRVTGFEALARFPQGPPDAWFARAHEVGHGAWLEAAALGAALAAPARPHGTALFLNLSPSVLCARQVAAVLPDDLDGVVLELTEQDLGEEGLLQRLAELRERGARIAVDDVGVGYASLLRLAQVRPDVVKLDRSLIRGVDDDPARRALVAAFVDFARETGAAVVAEGIETALELEVLADLDVGQGQGFVLARPAPAWPSPPPAVAELCRRLTSYALRTPAEVDAQGRHRLDELVAAELAGTRDLGELGAVAPLVAELLDADEVAFSRLLDDAGRPVLETISEHHWAPAGTRYALADFPESAAVLEGREARQVLVEDPEADPAEARLLTQTGYAALLMVTLVGRGRVLGMLEVYSRSPAPWTRRQISRARLAGHQAGTALAGFS